MVTLQIQHVVRAVVAPKGSRNPPRKPPKYLRHPRAIVQLSNVRTTAPASAVGANRRGSAWREGKPRNPSLGLGNVRLVQPSSARTTAPGSAVGANRRGSAWREGRHQ